MCRCYVVLTNENEAFLGTRIGWELNRINNGVHVTTCFYNDPVRSLAVARGSIDP